MDKPPPDDFDPYGDDGDMQISGDIPKSTLATAVLLWGVLAGLGAWTLSVVSDMRAEQRGQGQAIIAVNGRVDGLEKTVDRNSDDIRELQRARK